jgi:hypothetical protein
MAEKSNTRYFVAISLSLLLTIGLIFIGLRVEERMQRIETEVLERAPSSVPLRTVETAPVQITSAQTVYVPIYSHIFVSGGNDLPLESTLSIRNTDLSHPIIINSVSYHGTDGKLLREYLEEPVILGPMASIDFLVEAREMSGGVGANFLVEWVSEQRVSEPLIEAVMVGGNAKQSASFVRVGRPIENVQPKN